jgi:acyl-CoA thioester hydrolase
MEYIRKINYYETDNMGIVHHSNYIRYFEEARIDVLDKEGLAYNYIEELGILIPVLACECKYIKSAVFGMTVSIDTVVSSFNGVRMEMNYTVKNNENNELLATGSTQHCFLNKSFKPIRLKKEFPDIYEKFAKMTINNRL